MTSVYQIGVMPTPQGYVPVFAPIQPIHNAVKSYNHTMPVPPTFPPPPPPMNGIHISPAVAQYQSTIDATKTACCRCGFQFHLRDQRFAQYPVCNRCLHSKATCEVCNFKFFLKATQYADHPKCDRCLGKKPPQQQNSSAEDTS